LRHASVSLNSASHESIAGITPFEVYHGAPARNPFSSLLLDSPEVDEERELALPAEFAAAVAVSTRIFSQLATTHDQFVKNETAARLNRSGSARTFCIGDKVKVRVPPTAAQMEETGRRAKHITAWRGPCTIVERLSQTAYAATDDASHRRYERVLANLLPYRAQKAKPNANATFIEPYSTPFASGEFIAVRDDPTGPFYVARVELVSPKAVTLHYYGTTGMILANAIFLPCWHEVNGNEILMSWTCPEFENHGRHNFSEYQGEIDLADIHTVLVARHIEFTKVGKLRFRSARALAPFQDQLFRFIR
jgi:hypothetical protein